MSDNEYRTIAAFWYQWPAETRSVFGYLYAESLRGVWPNDRSDALGWFGRHMLRTRPS